jgi:primosomal protein N' (replication factor Y)
MFLIKLIPISKSISKETLTYFSKENVSIGSLVEAPIRNKTGFGLVISCEDLKENKADIKSLSYNLKKLGKIKQKQFITEDFMLAIKEISDYFACTSGQVLYSIISNNILENFKDIEFKDSGIEDKKQNQQHIASEILTIQAVFEERYAEYKSLIREEFARKKSVFFLVPSVEDIKVAKENLTKGIENYTYIFDSSMPKKEMILKWNEVLKVSHPVLIIATPLFLSIQREDLETIIVEKENSRGFISQIRPYLDFRKVIEIIGKKTNKKVVFGDMILRVETIQNVKKDNYKEFSSLKFRPNSQAQCFVIDMKNPEDKIKKEFRILSDELCDLIQESKEESKNLFIYCSRKGLNPITVCADCGDTVLCDNCDWPVVLYQKKANEKENIFICPKCGQKKETLLLCKKCQSWRLTPLGIGIELGAKEIAKKFPNIEIFLMDKDNVKTQKQAIKIIDKFYQTTGSILIGTEMALPYLNKKIENSAILSIDNLFSIPDFRINEKIMKTILTMRDLSLQKFLIQTRNSQNKIFEYGVKGNLLDFFKAELEERKEVQYPPFATFIKISLTGERLQVQKKMDWLCDFLKTENDDFEISVFKSFGSGINKNYTANCLIKIKNEKWPNKDLSQKLLSLTPDFSIKVDPDSIL